MIREGKEALGTRVEVDFDDELSQTKKWNF